MAEHALYVHDEFVHNTTAARIVLPMVFKKLNVASVLDVGCGLGTWLSVCDELGVKDYYGVDGGYVDKSKLAIDSSKFGIVDLRKGFALHRKFDLIICLEVVEHLPEASADVFVKSLINHGNNILFSAAIPGQGGQNHLNEQWPEYWESKFQGGNLYFHDVLRPAIWKNEKIEWWYRQNIFLITAERPEYAPFGSLSVVHPHLFEQVNKDHQKYHDELLDGRQGLRVAFKVFLNSFVFATKRLFNSFRPKK